MRARQPADAHARRHAGARVRGCPRNPPPSYDPPCPPWPELSTRSPPASAPGCSTTGRTCSTGCSTAATRPAAPSAAHWPARSPPSPAHRWRIRVERTAGRPAVANRPQTRCRRRLMAGAVISREALLYQDAGVQPGGRRTGAADSRGPVRERPPAHDRRNAPSRSGTAYSTRRAEPCRTASAAAQSSALTEISEPSTPTTM